MAGAAQPPQASVSYDHDSPRPGAVYCTPRGPHLFQPDDWRSRVETAPATVFEVPGENGIGGVINRLSPPVREVFQLFSTMLETPRIAPFTPKMSEADYAATLGMVPENVETLKAALDQQEVMGRLQSRMGTDRTKPQEPISRREQIAAALEASTFPGTGAR